jgi:myo-inositol-1(or 4)-monophosphatase
VIAQEAGALVTGSHDAFAASVDTADFGDVTEEILNGRKHLVVRGICDTEVQCDA